MANIRVDVGQPIMDGSEIIFIAPCDYTNVTGLNVYYPDPENSSEEKCMTFTFKDLHGYDLSMLDNVFLSGACVKVILNTTNKFANIQNADTNKYLEGRFDSIGKLINRMRHVRTITYDFSDEIMSISNKCPIILDGSSYTTDIIYNFNDDNFEVYNTSVIMGGKSYNDAITEIDNGIRINIPKVTDDIIISIQYWFNGGFYDESNTLLYGFYGQSMSIDKDFSINGSGDPESIYSMLKNDPALATCTKIILPEYIDRIGDYVFAECKNLTTVVIPDSVKSIGKGAFKSCESLKSINIPDSVTEIGWQAFGWCHALESVKLSKNITKLQSYMFDSCTSLTSIDIPYGIKYMNAGIFEGCTALKYVDIPDSVIEMGGSIFSGCTALEYVDLSYNIRKLPHRMFEGCKSLKSIDIPDTVAILEWEVFSYCESLRRIKLPDSIRTIGNDVFEHCTALESVIFPRNIKTISNGMFSYCTSLWMMKIPDTVTAIRRNAFWGCKSLSDVVIPNSVAEIGFQAFYNCEPYRVYFEQTTPPIFEDECFMALTGKRITFYFRNQDVSDALIAGNHYSSNYGTKSTDYDWTV